VKRRYFWIIILILLLIVSLFLTCGVFNKPPPDVFVGIDVAYDNVAEIKLLVDEIRPYTNTIVIGTTGITFDMAKLDDVCQYVYDRNFYFMIYAHPMNDPDALAIQRQWVLDAKPRWGERFLGLYAFDEPGGRQLDNASYKVVPDEEWSADNYKNWTAAADTYVNTLFVDYLHHTIEDQMGGIDLPLFTSDYALYWFDYKATYDVVFAEFGWNYSRTINVALDRGAANVQNREWGVMITWTYTQPLDNESYLESGKELYNDLVLAYENGAQYILVFDTNKNYTHSTLKKSPERLDALKQFWQYATDNPRSSDPPSDRVAYVLPKDYGYGFRGPNDTIWGLWNATDYNDSLRISTEIGGLIDTYQNRLDIIYDDGLEANNTYGYGKLIFWNGTVWVP
jgi:hypothetical protein